MIRAAAPPACYMDRAFIQLAGFTWGLDHLDLRRLFDATPFHLNYVVATNGSIGATGIWQWRYTAQFGNGIYGAVAVEDPQRRRGAIIGAAERRHAGGRISSPASARISRWGRVAATVAIHDCQHVPVHAPGLPGR